MKSAVSTSSGVFECVVTREMCAELDATLIHPVYSTFWLCYHAEVAARRAIEPFFDENENAVGGEIFLRHDAMCGIGDTVRITARVTDVTTRKVVCEIEARSSTRLIAHGHQVQIVMSQAEIDALVRQAYDRIA